MKINRINLYNQNVTPQKTQNVKSAKTQNLAYNPIAYRDYNVNFTARLFRTPEDFYSQPFNQKGMPKMMKDYLYEDFSDRQKMPPAQMLETAYEDIKGFENLDDIKTEFSSREPLFANLTDTPKVKSRTGILAEIDLMREDGKTLFKNGKDNLGTYILKKIFLEGKTMKEINEDFKRDVSVHYAGLSPIEHSTLTAFGIEYPDKGKGFWHSFTANRANFPYVYRPRKVSGDRKTAERTSSSHIVPKASNKFAKVKDWEIDKLADALVNGNGNEKETLKHIKKSCVSDKEELTFIQKYMGEINSVVLEKLHISPDMHYYFENYNNLSKSQQKKFTEYMKQPDINELRSKVMKSTIRFFFDVYGVDGNNEEFKELIEYAHNIKPNRIARQAEHDRLQAEYERELGIFDTEEKLLNVETLKTEPQISPAKMLEDVKKHAHVFQIGNDEVVLVGDLREGLQDVLKADTELMPQVFANKFIKFVKEQPEVTDKYILSRFLLHKNFDIPQDERLISADEVHNINMTLYQRFTNTYPQESRAAQQAILDSMLEAFGHVQNHTDLYTFGTFDYIRITDTFSREAKDEFLRKTGATLNKKYSEYLRPLTSSEVNKITINIIDLMKKYNHKEFSVIVGSQYETALEALYSMTLPVKSKSDMSLMKNYVYGYLKEFGGNARIFLNKSLGQKEKLAKLEQFMLQLWTDKPSFTLQYITANKECMDYLKVADFHFYQMLKAEVLPYMFHHFK